MYDEGGLEFHEGTPEDVRLIVAAMTAEVKDGPRYEAVPWERFHHAYGPGDDVPRRLAQVRHGDVQSADRELGTLWNSLCHQGGASAAGALSVPFLIRTALTHPRASHRASILLLVGSLARRSHFGDGSRTGLLRASLPTGSLVYEPSGYVGTWSVQAAQQAIAADADLLVPLLDNPAAGVRTATAYALSAAALPLPDGITAALHTRFDTEDDPVVRASLVLAIGQLAWEDRDTATIARTRTWWQDPARPLDVRISAALAWLCLVDDPIPTDLDAFLDTEITDEIASLLAPVPWLRDVDDDGLRTTLTQMRNPDDYPWFTERVY